MPYLACLWGEWFFYWGEINNSGVNCFVYDCFYLKKEIAFSKIETNASSTISTFDLLLNGNGFS